MTLWMMALIGCSWSPQTHDEPVAGAALGPGDERPVWMFRQRGGTWSRSADAVAHRASSLGVGMQGDRLVLTMQCFWGDCGNEAKRREIGPPVHALTSADLNEWRPAMWRLVDPDDRVPIDTELRGDSVWYYGTQAGMRGDPAEHRQPHSVFRARIEGDRLVNPERVIEGPSFADPAPVTVGAETLLFLTTQPGRAIGLARGNPLAVQREWTGVSVPHAMMVGDDIWLWAQTVREGRMIPVRSISVDRGQSWSDWASPLPLDGIDGCGNPVGIVFQGDPVVFCVTEPLMGPRP